MISRERHDPRHVDRLERRGHPVGDVRVEERRVLGRDDELGLAEHVERAAARHAVDRGDDRLPEVARLRADVVARVVEHERRAAASRRRRDRSCRRVSPPICSMRSMPVQNAFSPAPVSTMQRTSSWRRSARHSVCSSRCISELNALCTSGRFSVTVRDAVSLLVRDRLELGNRGHGRARTRRCASMPGVLAAEAVAVEDAADVGRVPLLRRAVLLGGEELLAHRPALVEREVVADEAEHLAGDVQRLVGGEPHDAGRRVAGVHRLELGVVLGVLHLDLHRLRDHARGAAGADAVGAHAVAARARGSR